MVATPRPKTQKAIVPTIPQPSSNGLVCSVGPMQALVDEGCCQQMVQNMLVSGRSHSIEVRRRGRSSGVRSRRGRSGSRTGSTRAGRMHPSGSCSRAVSRRRSTIGASAPAAAVRSAIAAGEPLRRDAETRRMDSGSVRWRSSPLRVPGRSVHSLGERGAGRRPVLDVPAKRVVPR